MMVGIDVASAPVDVACLGAALPAELAHVSNDAEGHSALADALVKLQPGLVLMEATGGYEAAMRRRWRARCKQRGCAWR